MDAKVGDWVVTPRIGKPVEVQALWLNALWIAGAFSDRWRELARPRARVASTSGSGTRRRAASTTSSTPITSPEPRTRPFRPNQIFAVGGLPFALVEGERARRIVDAVEARLCDAARPALARRPEDPAYVGRYEGGPRERDGAYHQGTVWPFLAGAFVDAWVRVARRARRRRSRGARALPRAAPGASRRSRSRPRLRDRRRRRAAHAARLPVPGLVGRGAPADRPRDPGRPGTWKQKPDPRTSCERMQGIAWPAWT